jgi:hypothetical protein
MTTAKGLASVVMSILALLAIPGMLNAAYSYTQALNAIQQHPDQASQITSDMIINIILGQIDPWGPILFTALVMFFGILLSFYAILRRYGI